MRGRTGSTPVSTGCARPARGRAGLRAGLDRRPASLQVSEPVRAGERAIRRSVDRRGRPTRRDPDVRRGATATLTAPSTARQRSGWPPGRVGSGVPPPPRDRRPGGPWAVGIRPAVRPPRFLGYAGWSLWTGPPAISRVERGTSGQVRAVRSVRSDQLPGSPGIARIAVRPGRPARIRPPVGAHRRCRVVGVPREQAHVPAEQPPSVQDPRLPAADADPRGPGDPRRPSAQGSREALRLTCCPRRHACAGVRSSPRSSGPAGAPGGRPWCSTSSPNGPSRRSSSRRGRRQVTAAVRCAGRFRGRQGRRQLGGPPPRDPAAAGRRRAPSCTGCPPSADLVVRARPEAADADSAVLRRDLVAGLDRLLGDRVGSS